MTSGGIGGYFELELPNHGAFLYEDGVSLYRTLLERFWV